LTAGKRPATAESGESVASSPRIKVRVLCQRIGACPGWQDNVFLFEIAKRLSAIGRLANQTPDTVRFRERAHEEERL